MQKKIIIKQQDEKDCGVCCLLSILKYYDGFVPLEKIRIDTYTKDKGTSAFHMVETLKMYGFDAYGSRVKKEAFFKTEFPLPAIVHVVLDNGCNHYMVLYEKRNGKVILMDPSIGKKVMSDTDFFWIWSEILIIAYPKQKICCYGKEKNKFSMINAFLGKEKKSFFHMIYIEILSIILTIISTFYLKIAINYLKRLQQLIIISAFFVIISFFKILLQKEMMIGTKDLSKKLEVTHTTNYLNHLFSLPLSNYESRNVGDYLTRFWESFELKYLYTDVLKNAILALNVLFFSFCCLFLYNETFFHFYILISCLYLAFQVCFQKQSYQMEYEFLREKTNFQGRLLEEMKSIPIYHYLSQKSVQNRMVEKTLISFLECNHQKEGFYHHFSFYQMVLRESTNLALILLGIIFLRKGKIEIIDFFFIESIGSYLIHALETLVSQLPKEKYLKNILKKNYEFLEVKTEQKEETGKHLLWGDIKIEGLTFSYNQYHYILKDLNMNIIAGTHMLLQGTSGCGKSTLCKMLTKVYEPTMGTIKIGKDNLSDIDSFTIRKNILYLNQESHLITGTIKENILLHRNYNETKFQKVCEICHIEEIVSKKPLRYETTISSQENNFSGGEKQRIILARTLYSDAKIFLLDESLCEVDEKLEKAIIKEMREFLKSKTLIYISHKNHKSLFDDVEKLEVCHERVPIS